MAAAGTTVAAPRLTKLFTTGRLFATFTVEIVWLTFWTLVALRSRT